MDDLSRVYQDKKVLVTGHTGFVGGWLSLWLTRLGARVAGYSLEPPTEPSLFEAAQLRGQITCHYHGDVRDYEELEAAMRRFEPEIVFHLAAQPLVQESYRSPKATYETNVLGTVNVLEAIRTTRTARACLVVTSDKCYENREWPFGYREIDSLGGHDPYSSSKACAEIVAGAYSRSFFNGGSNGRKSEDRGQTTDDGAVLRSPSSVLCSLASVRAGNIIGGGDWGRDRIIPDTIKALTQSEPIVLRHPTASRPWQFVLEPVSGYLWLAALLYLGRDEYAGPWNLGPNEARTLTVEHLVRLFMQEWGDGQSKLVCEQSPLHETNLLRLDTNKASSILGWRAVYTVYDAVRETVHWYKEFYSQEAPKMCDIMHAQIDKYVDRARKQGVRWAEGIWDEELLEV